MDRAGSSGYSPWITKIRTRLSTAHQALSVERFYMCDTNVSFKELGKLTELVSETDGERPEYPSLDDLNLDVILFVTKILGASTFLIWAVELIILITIL